MFRVFWHCRCCRFSCCLDSQFQDTRVHHFTKIWTSSLWGDDCCLACVDGIINGQLGQCMELASACCASPVMAVWLHAMHVLYPRLVGVERARIGGKCLAHVLADRCHPRSQEYEHGRQQLNQESKSVNVIPQSFWIQHCWRQLGRACKLVSLKLVPYRPAGGSWINRNELVWLRDFLKPGTCASRFAVWDRRLKYISISLEPRFNVTGKLWVNALSRWSAILWVWPSGKFGVAPPFLRDNIDGARESERGLSKVGGFCSHIR